MNIEQIKKDQDNNVIVSRETYRKLVEAALMMKNTLESIEFRQCGWASDTSSELLALMEII